MVSAIVFHPHRFLIANDSLATVLNYVLLPSLDNNEPKGKPLTEW